ncbi:MAG: hypothetical protein ACD_38C00060G0002 [uncultured bacterium]|uniref:Uncharacterized protein n=1 Tax=Candidatus Daviesbacteria bacterium GW2011_GWC2_40_12 TaxID=1618431 RepID=A0A0G0TTX6_9BACT|nr:MAG: hypothetical protein ACD_38C00060G0002 [uncultured bacterium]KKQ82597.1 MAG: hypothetical protein UT04_C0055G0008 [Candidatus Daviesbacteria bacterium GW2011_GWF2_38_7]KKR16478.1 MAG: hypothetical protein UT45_C0005G0007 [Candidatus Daviesbacteria bacterium GW2011_GWA2_39_33]KKR22885.1 MAG: hypothetical protein UT54_C0060G0003 [Candidatus Daviesbacteria bacterium GW2011_GWB1_39_5]KKR41347.1 MAG: hypothetical protein UT77_C0013G0017 [Candidatus Daviesbacteria bacterium GW2011_GWC2_40_12]
MPQLPLNLVNLILLFTAIIAAILYLREYNKRKKLEVEGDKFLQGLKEKGWETLNQSIKKSQAILGEAELEGIKAVAGNKVELSKLDADYAKQINIALNKSEQTIALAQNQLMQFMQNLQKRSEAFEEAGIKTGEQRINQLFEKIETRVSDFLVQTEQKSLSSIELELKAAREMIDSYKNQKFKLIDENIVAMMEQTLSIVLAKKLALKDQLDLIYEALEKAKAEKFIV